MDALNAILDLYLMDLKIVGAAHAILIVNSVTIIPLLDAILALTHFTLMMIIYALLTRIADKIAGNAYLVMPMKNALYALQLMESHISYIKDYKLAIVLLISHAQSTVPTA
jgi:hypothetical protein